MGNMKNFRAEDMPNTKKVAYAGKEPAEQAPDGQAQFGSADNRYGTRSANQGTPEAPEAVEGGQETGQQPQGGDEVPDGTAKEVTDWVGDDPERAQRALDAENAQGEDARSTLVEDLERVIRRNEDNDEDEQQA